MDSRCKIIYMSHTLPAIHAHIVGIGSIEVHVVKQGDALYSQVPKVTLDVKQLNGFVLLPIL